MHDVQLYGRTGRCLLARAERSVDRGLDADAVICHAYCVQRIMSDESCGDTKSV